MIEEVVDRVASILERVIPDKGEARRLAHEISIAEMESSAKAQQLQIQANIEAAKNPSVFVSGARPAAIWLILFMLFYNYVVYPAALFATKIWFPEFDVNSIPAPIEDTSDMFLFLGGLLGLVSARSIEKLKGVARNAL